MRLIGTDALQKIFYVDEEGKSKEMKPISSKQLYACEMIINKLIPLPEESGRERDEAMHKREEEHKKVIQWSAWQAWNFINENSKLYIDAKWEKKLQEAKDIASACRHSHSVKDYSGYDDDCYDFCCYSVWYG